MVAIPTHYHQKEHGERLLKAWAEVPELRLGQLIANALALRVDRPGGDLFYVDDVPLVEAIEKFVTAYKQGKTP